MTTITPATPISIAYPAYRRGLVSEAQLVAYLRARGESTQKKEAA
jgi:hypothetical protein